MKGEESRGKERKREKRRGKNIKRRFGGECDERNGYEVKGWERKEEKSGR